MAGFAREATPEEIKAAAEYFAALPIPQGWVKVKEVSMVPKTKIAGNVYFELEGAQAGKEPIGNRVIEVPEDPVRVMLRDPKSGFVSYAPPGRGRGSQGQANASAAEANRASSARTPKALTPALSVLSGMLMSS